MAVDNDYHVGTDNYHRYPSSAWWFFEGLTEPREVKPGTYNQPETVR